MNVFWHLVLCSLLTRAFLVRGGDENTFILRLNLKSVNSSTATFDYYISHSLDDDLIEAMNIKDEIEEGLNSDLNLLPI